jgi:hypothetical protein
VIGLKLVFVFGAGHLIRHASAPVAIVVFAAVVLFGFASRFLGR